MENPRDKTLGVFLREFRLEITAYIEARLDLTRLSTYEKTAQLASATIFFVIITGLLTVVVILLSIALSMYLGSVLGEHYLGFAAVAGIYILTGLLLFLLRKRISEKIHSTTLDILMKNDLDNDGDNNN